MNNTSNVRLDIYSVAAAGNPSPIIQVVATSIGLPPVTVNRKVHLLEPLECSDLVDEIESTFGPAAAGDVRTLLDKAIAEDRTPGNEVSEPTFKIETAASLIRENPTLAEPVINGLIRRGEVGNLIAGPKTRKTYMVLGLALTLSVGGEWLGKFKTSRGKVLIIDNELHKPTLASRLEHIARKMDLEPSDYGDQIHIISLRGNLKSFIDLGPFLGTIAPGTYQAIIFDAAYRMWPADMDENANGQMTNIYNTLDRYAQMLNAALILVHHTSKGVQGFKSVTDTGSGAGSQSRAADMHAVLREHEEQDCVVFEAVTRSFAPQSPICLRWDYPLWASDDTLDATLLKKENSRGGRPRKTDGETSPKEAKAAVMTPIDFVNRYCGKDLKDKKIAIAQATLDGETERNSGRLLTVALSMNLVYERKQPPSKVTFLSTEPPDLIDVGSAYVSRAHSPHTPQ